MSANVNLNATGLTSLYQDPNPTLGANLVLNGFNITGTGNYNVTGSITATSVSAGTISGFTTLSGLTSVTTTAATIGNINPTSGSVPLTFNANTQAIAIYGISSAGSVQGAFFKTYQSRGTIASPVTINSGDYLAGTFASAYQGANYVPVGSFGIIQDSNYSFNNSSASVPGLFSVGLLNNGSIPTLSQSLTFNSQGVLYAPIFKVGSWATGSYPSSPAKGTIIFDSTANHFYGYNGTSWVQFTGP
jgi:hypothetical protein